jgi:hypothetical protein
MFGRNSHLTLAKKRINEMNRALASVERIAKKASARTEGKKLISELRKRQAQFLVATDQMKDHIVSAEARMKKLNAAGSASWSAFRTALAKSHKAFTGANRKAGKAIRRAVR